MVSMFETVSMLAAGAGQHQLVGAGAEVDGAGGDAAPSVMVSAPVPPVMVSALETVTVLAPFARVEGVGAGAEVDDAGGTAVPRVMVSAWLPPVTVSTLETVTVLAPVGERQAVGAAIEVDRPLKAVARVTASAPVPPVTSRRWTG